MDPQILDGPSGCFQTSEVQRALLLGLPPLSQGYRTFLVPSPHPSWALSLLRLHSALVTTLTPGPTSISAHLVLNPLSRVLSCIFSA